MQGSLLYLKGVFEEALAMLLAKAAFHSHIAKMRPRCHINPTSNYLVGTVLSNSLLTYMFQPGSWNDKGSNPAFDCGMLLITG